MWVCEEPFAGQNEFTGVALGCLFVFLILGKWINYPSPQFSSFVDPDQDAVSSYILFPWKDPNEIRNTKAPC